MEEVCVGGAGRVWYLEVREVVLHEAVDLTDRQAARLAVLQSHGDQTAGRSTRTARLAPQQEPPG